MWLARLLAARMRTLQVNEHIVAPALRTYDGQHLPESASDPSEIGPIRLRDRRFLFCVIFMPVFGADQFRPWAHAGPISDGRRPRHREDALILDGKMQLQHLAAIIGV